MNKLISTLCSIAVLIGLANNTSATTTEGIEENRMWESRSYVSISSNDIDLVVSPNCDYKIDTIDERLLKRWADGWELTPEEDAIVDCFFEATKELNYSWWHLRKKDFAAIQHENDESYPQYKISHITMEKVMIPEGGKNNYKNITKMMTAAFAECPDLSLLDINFELDDGTAIRNSGSLSYYKLTKIDNAFDVIFKTKDKHTGKIKSEICDEQRLRQILNGPTAFCLKTKSD